MSTPISRPVQAFNASLESKTHVFKWVCNMCKETGSTSGVGVPGGATELLNHITNCGACDRFDSVSGTWTEDGKPSDATMFRDGPRFVVKREK